MATSTIQSDRHIDYGVDAPGVIRTLAGVGVAGLFGGIALAGLSPWPALNVAGWLILIVALAPLTLAAMMVAYAVAGKRRFRDWILARHAWRGDEHVLDVGAGRGLMTVGAARLVPRGRVTAIDIWRPEDLGGNGIDALRANLDAAAVTGRVRAETMDARAMRLADGSVDVVLSVLCLHNIEPPPARRDGLAEIARVLRPGGVAFIADYTGTRSYADTFRGMGLEVTGPVNAIPVALSLMFMVAARKPSR
jgi:SAM-dependent methyltransferase